MVSVYNCARISNYRRVCVDYIHYNPVKQNYVKQVIDYMTLFTVKVGIYSVHWGGISFFEKDLVY